MWYLSPTSACVGRFCAERKWGSAINKLLLDGVDDLREFVGVGRESWNVYWSGSSAIPFGSLEAALNIRSKPSQNPSYRLDNLTSSQNMDHLPTTWFPPKLRNAHHHRNSTLSFEASGIKPPRLFDSSIPPQIRFSDSTNPSTNPQPRRDWELERMLNLPD